MEFTERDNINGKMICIDFKKAFDTVSRDFLFKTLHAFGFGNSFIQWIHTFYENISSCVLKATAPFPVERGVGQGDPLSAYLFIMVLEILCISIRRIKDIPGITVGTVNTTNRTEVTQGQEHILDKLFSVSTNTKLL